MSPVWCNGEFLDGPLAIAVTDRGLSHGLGLFETLLAIDGQARALDLHLARLEEGAQRLGLDPIDGSAVAIAIHELLVRRDLTRGRARVRISLSAGSGDLRALSQGNDSLLWITATPAADAPASLSLATASFPRNELSPLAGIKCLSYAENLLALDQARRAGADEALFYNTRGELCEATTSNIFLVREGRIATPPLSSGCLPGTMRQRVLERCRDLEIETDETILTRADLLECDAAFTTSAIRGVVPVSVIDGQPLPQCPGTISGLLRSECVRLP
ncbi:aminotransferase class IV [Luteolibacter sp. Populi]|uniref:aminotransferase class IV n=1 Tax=Luteolibacter sp. Populi TaxID=3230487 RepID=UPI0034672C48